MMATTMMATNNDNHSNDGHMMVNDGHNNDGHKQ